MVILGSTVVPGWKSDYLASVVWIADYIKNMTLESVSDSVPGVSHIFYITPVTFKVIIEINAVACAIHHDIVCLAIL